MKNFGLFIVIFLVSKVTIASGSPVITLATIEAPPFFGEKMPEQGAGAFALKEVFKKMGYELQLKFMPFTRAKMEALHQDAISGFVPCSDTDVVDGFEMSKTPFQTKTLLIERKDFPIAWTSTKDLEKYRGGHVTGNSLKAPISKDKARLNIEDAPDDVANLLKLANHRVDYIFMTDGTFLFLLKTDPRVKVISNLIQPNARPVTMVHWGIAFEKSAQGSKLKEAFNSKVDFAEFKKNVEIYLKKLKK